MEYSYSFKQKVKRLFPNSTQAHKMVDEGNTYLGRFLDDSSSNFIYINDILSAETLADLKKQALLQKEKVDLYREWSDLYQKELNK